MFLRTGLSFVLAVALAKGAAAEPAPAGDMAGVQGHWVRTQNTPNGPVRIVKQHAGNRSFVTAFDAGGAIVHAHESDFALERHGKLRVFVFSNRKITAGPNAGQVVREPSAFVYRVDGDRFVEAYGLLEGDANPPGMIVWERQIPAKRQP